MIVERIIFDLQRWLTNISEATQKYNYCLLKDHSLEYYFLDNIFSQTQVIKLQKIELSTTELDSVISLYKYSQNSQSLMIAGHNKNDYRLLRNYNKLFAMSDVLLLAEFSQLDIINICKALNIIDDQIKKAEEDRSLLKSHGFSEIELEWLDLLEDRTHIITSEQDPAKYYGWFGFSGRQKEIISKLYNIEKQTRDRINSNVKIYKK